MNYQGGYGGGGGGNSGQQQYGGEGMGMGSGGGTNSHYDPSEVLSDAIATVSFNRFAQILILKMIYQFCNTHQKQLLSSPFVFETVYAQASLENKVLFTRPCQATLFSKINCLKKRMDFSKSTKSKNHRHILA